MTQQYIDDIDTEISFGKHNGWTFQEVLEGEPQYLNWAAETETIEFSDELLEYIEIYMQERKRKLIPSTK